MLVKNVRLSFPSLFRATAFDEKQEPKFSGQFIMPKGSEQHEQVRKAIRETIADKWGEKPGDLTADRICLKSGATKVAKDGGYMDGYGPDVVFFNASSLKRPGVYDADRTPLTEQDGRPYAGCYVNVQVTFWAQDNKWGKRINAELNGVQFVADGEFFGGSSAPAQADDFPELEPSATEATGEAEPADDFDDDIPF